MIEGEFSMIPFEIGSRRGLEGIFSRIAGSLLRNVDAGQGIAFLTVHGRKLRAGQTLRRGGPHTDGNYDRSVLDWGGGWKIGENGPPIGSRDHARLYETTTGGIILASNFPACLGWTGEFDGLPGVGGDCSHISLNKPFMLERDTVYYGNNHFVHESLPVSEGCHRVFARITLPSNHRYHPTQPTEGGER